MGDHGTYVNIEEYVTEEKLFPIFLNNVYKLAGDQPRLSQGIRRRDG